MTDTSAAITARMEEWKRAFERKDVDAVMAFYQHDAFTGFDLMAPIEFRGEEQWRQNWVAFFAAFDGAPALEFAEVEITSEKRLAVVRLLNRLSGMMNGSPLSIWVRQTNCFRLVGGEWLMFHDHVSVPTDFATGRSLLGLSPRAPFGRL